MKNIANKECVYCIDNKNCAILNPMKCEKCKFYKHKVFLTKEIEKIIEEEKEKILNYKNKIIKKGV